MACTNLGSKKEFYDSLPKIARVYTPDEILNHTTKTYRLCGIVFAEYIPKTTTEDQLWTIICQRHNLNPHAFDLIPNQPCQKPCYIVRARVSGAV